jgi:hypothetical protein
MTTTMIHPFDTARQCASPGCDRERHNGELCNTHLRIAEAGLPHAESVWVARRLANVRWVGECLIWQGAPNNMGYGKVGVRNDPSTTGREEAVHRWFYKRFIGPIPEGLVLDHLCRTPLCVNVMHLEPVTAAENTRRGFVSRGFGDDRTHCKYGHEWTPETIITESGKRPGLTSRKCRTCKREQDSARHRRNREEAIA